MKTFPAMKIMLKSIKETRKRSRKRLIRSIIKYLNFKYNRNRVACTYQSGFQFTKSILIFKNSRLKSLACFLNLVLYFSSLRIMNM